MNYDLQVLYEDNHLIAVNKPAGMLVHGDETGDKPLSEFVKAYIAEKYDKPGAVFLGVIHRLDRPVSGLVIFARTSKALARMNRLFKERKITKTYLAITSDRPDPHRGKLVHFILKDRSRNVAKAYDRRGSRTQEAKESVLEYRLVASLDTYHLLEVNPHTGRPHQIRVQLSKLGCPILGDVKYDYPRPRRDGSILLHSYEMTFEHPVKREPFRLTAAVPSLKEWALFSEFLT